MNRRRVSTQVLLYFLMMMFLMVIGCSKSDNAPAAASTTVSGVAAAGAPIIGFAYLIDVNLKQAGPVTIDSSGNFSFSLDASYVPPFVIKAEGSAGGEQFKLYSATSSYGTANVNPFTNLAVANATGAIPSDVYAGVNSYYANLTTTSLQTAITNIQTMLQPLLTANNITTFNPLSGTYTANGTGLDGIIDAVTIQVNQDKSVELINKTDGTTISSGTISSLPAAMDSTTAAAIAQTTSDLTAIGNMLTSFAAALNKGASLTAADLEPLYVGSSSSTDVFGYNNGFDRTDTITDMVSSFSSGKMTSLGGISAIKNLTLVRKINPLYNTKTNANSSLTSIYEIRADFYFTPGNDGRPDGAMLVANEGGKWKLIGNQWLVDITMEAEAQKYDLVNGTTQFWSGITTRIVDQGGLNINSARLMGPGLPSDGITYSKTTDSVNEIILDNQNTSLWVDNWSLYTMNDSVINTLSTGKNAYTMTLYSQSTAPAPGTPGVQQTSLTLFAKPVLNAALDSTYFGSITMTGINHTIAFANTNIIGKTASFTITKPTTYVVSWLSADTWFYASGGKETMIEVPLTATSVNITSPAISSPTSGFVGIMATDGYNREFGYYYKFQ